MIFGMNKKRRNSTSRPNPIVAKKGLKIVNKEVKKACGSQWNMV
jgi:hypothetical protein